MLDPERRRKLHTVVNTEIREFQIATGRILLSGIKEGACAKCNTFKHLFNTRFHLTINNEGWITLATQDDVMDHVQVKTARKTIKKQLHQFKNNLKQNVDNGADYLIVFALFLRTGDKKITAKEVFREWEP